MSTRPIYQAVVEVVRRRLPPSVVNAPRGLAHLDIGPGRGELIQCLRNDMIIESSACDAHVERLVLNDVACVRVDLNRDALPFPEGRFDLVTSTEVLEHLENYRALLREAYRVMAEGAVLVITTPNVLNATSRMRYLVSGFASLFGPLPVRNDRLYSAAGHITPIPYFYLAHALLDAGFTDLELEIDKVQRTSVFWLVPLAPILLFGWWYFVRRESVRRQTITTDNRRHVVAHSSWRMLVGRTIVLSAAKLGSPARTLASAG